MKKHKKQLITILLFLPFITFLLFSCSSEDDDNTPENEELSCDVAGIINENLVGVWTGEIYFDSNNSSYAQTNRFEENGTLSSSGPNIPTLNGCWRVNGEFINYVGTLNYNNEAITASFSGRIITQDSIYGTHTSSNGESGFIWMVR